MAGTPSQKDWAAGLYAMKRIARPEEIASAALFLASPMASFVTDQLCLRMVETLQ